MNSGATPLSHAHAREARPEPPVRDRAGAKGGPHCRVLICTLSETIGGSGTAMLKGRFGAADVIGLHDRKAQPGLLRWAIFASSPSGGRVYMASLAEKRSAAGVRRLSGKLGPMQLVAYPDREAPPGEMRWRLFVERSAAHGANLTGGRNIGQNAPTESAQRGRIPQCETE